MGRVFTEARHEGFFRRAAMNVGSKLIRFGLGPTLETHYPRTGHLVLQVNEVTDQLERMGLLQRPVDKEVVEFGLTLRRLALPAVLEKGLVGLEEFGPILVPGDEAGDIIERMLTFEYAGKKDHPSAWKTHIAQLWLTRDLASDPDPMNVRRTIVGTCRLDPPLS